MATPTLADRAAAKIWIVENQFNRRNLTLFARCKLMLVLEPLVAAKAKENQKRSKGRSKKGPSILTEQIDTRDEMAKKANVANSTISTAKFILDNADGRDAVSCCFNESKRGNAWPHHGRNHRQWAGHSKTMPLQSSNPTCPT